jgi:hypothetical protein
LYICRNIVAALGGRITLASPDCGGAVFEVLLTGISADRGGPPRDFRSALLEPLVCELELAEAVRNCVANFLARLGVRFQAIGSGERSDRGDVLELLISEAGPRHSGSRPCLLITPRGSSGSRPAPRLLKPPLLQSSLASSLLVIALDWRSCSLRNENRD